MKLAEYLTRAGIKKSQFAKQIGSPVSVVSRLVRGERDPSVETLKRIIDATDGSVSINDFNAVEERKRNRDGEAAA